MTEPSGFSQPERSQTRQRFFLAKWPTCSLSPIINSCRTFVLGTNVAGRRIGVKEAAAARVSLDGSSVQRRDTTAGRRAQ